MKVTANNNNSRGLIISQDLRDIYLTFATYNTSYLEYLRNRRHGQEAQRLLTMQEYGSWDIGSHDDIQHLAQIIVAFVLRARDGR